MAVTRKKKESMLESYIQDLKAAKWVYVLSQYGISVNEMNRLRKSVWEEGAKLKMIKKKVFLKGLSEAGVEEIWLDKLQGSVMLLFSYDSEYEPLKLVHNIRKSWWKEGKDCQINYLWGWMYWNWLEAEYVEELAKLPSRDELVWKFAFLLNYPVQSFAYALDQISKTK